MRCFKLQKLLQGKCKENIYSTLVLDGWRSLNQQDRQTVSLIVFIFYDAVLYFLLSDSSYEVSSAYMTDVTCARTYLFKPDRRYRAILAAFSL